MKKKIVVFSILLLFINNSQSIYAQKIDNFRPKFFSLHNAKFSLGLGIDGSFSSLNIKASKPNDLKVIYKDPTKDSVTVSYVAAGLSFDFYSPNSLTGLMFGVNYAFCDITTTDISRTKYDYFSLARLEFPAYLRLRPGKRDAKEHLLFLIGGIFNLPVGGTRKLMSKPYGYFQEDSTDNSKKQFKTFVSLSTSVGFEFFEGKKNNSRMTAYINCDYPLGNSINTDYKDFKPGGNSTLANYNNFKISQFRFGIGLRYFIGFRKYKM